MISVEAGSPFRLDAESSILPGCTVSERLMDHRGDSLSIFYLDEGTDISAELYDYPKIIVLLKGTVQVEGKDLVHPFDALSTSIASPTGVKAKEKSIYAELSLRKDTHMNPALQNGEVFSLKEKVPYQKGKIVNMDIVSEPNLKFVVMAFDEGTGLSEHAAPGEAIVTALDGEGIIGYEGKEYVLREGENFKFAKGGKHYVKAIHRFKMSLLLTLGE